MGCDLLALDLGESLFNPSLFRFNVIIAVRNWEFLLLSPIGMNLHSDADPRKLLRRRSSLVVADLPVQLHTLEPHSATQRHPPASVFEEPESSSLLDNFGF